MFTIRTLGSNGRWGNQLFQYCYGKYIAEKFNTDLYIPENWIGREVFEINDPIITEETPNLNRTIPDNLVCEDNYDIFGYYQNAGALQYSHDDIKRWLQFRPEILQKFNEIEKPSFYTAIHLRRDDYFNLSHLYCIVGVEAYLNAINVHNIPTDALMIVSDDMQNQPLNPFKPQTGLSFLHDFFILMNASYLLRSNSTFSWWAAVLGDIENVWSPRILGKTGLRNDVEFEKGNHCEFFDPSIHPTPHTELYIKRYNYGA